ncbi:DUF4124 domain-containing protein [Allochromatium palmeri]|uniref:DUF4124 domain-containing protein n=1 Tax=Allochromatium palmeri TaxID=231048 RepID=UPI001642D12E
MLFSALGLASWAVLAQQLYRWVDDQGEVHYTDQVPPKYAGKARARLSEQGIAVEIQPALPTGEARERARELERQRIEDERLLQRYRTVDELELARDGRLAAVEAAIQAKRDDMRDESRKLIALYAEIQALQTADKPVPIDLMGKVDASLTHIRTGYTEIIDNEDRKQEVKDEFEHTIEQFRRLRRLPDPVLPRKRDRNRPKDPPLVSCREQALCHVYWERAVDYVRQYSDRDGEVLGPGLLMAFQDDERERRTLTIAWTQKAADQPVRIYLDIQCKNRLTASLICIDPRVPKVRAGFKAAVMAE